MEHGVRIVWEDDDYVEAWNELIAAGCLRPNVEIAERFGSNPNAVAQRLYRLRKAGRIVGDGNVLRGMGCCPHCGASLSHQRPERAATRRALGVQS